MSPRSHPSSPLPARALSRAASAAALLALTSLLAALVLEPTASPTPLPDPSVPTSTRAETSAPSATEFVLDAPAPRAALSAPSPRASERVAPGVVLETWRAYGSSVYLVRMNPAERSSLDVALARDQLRGTELTSSIARRTRALVAVNGDFAAADGRPLHLLVQDGALVQSPLVRGRTLTLGPDGRSVMMGYPDLRLTATELPPPSPPAPAPTPSSLPPTPLPSPPVPLPGVPAPLPPVPAVSAPAVPVPTAPRPTTSALPLPSPALPAPSPLPVTIPPLPASSPSASPSSPPPRPLAAPLSRVNTGAGRPLAGFSRHGAGLPGPARSDCTLRALPERAATLTADGSLVRTLAPKSYRCATQSPASSEILLAAPARSDADRLLRRVGEHPGRGARLELRARLGAPHALDAVGGNPMLVAHSRVIASEVDQPGRFHGVNPRTAVGVTSRGELLLVVADGRTRASRGLTLRELAQFLDDRGAELAMNLDGGGSSTLVVRGEVRNRPSDGRERPVSSALVILAGPDPGEAHIRRPAPAPAAPRLLAETAPLPASSELAALHELRAQLAGSPATDPGSTAGLLDHLTR